MTEPMTVRVTGKVGEVPPEIWDRLANPDAATHNPFVAHAFFQALEDAGCVGGRTGWRPHHLLLETAAGEVVGVAPCYLKTHSQGEYIFDHGWADAYQRAGGQYYPKLQIAVPFTPVPGPRFLVGDGAEADERRRLLAQGAVEVASQLGVSSLHATFCTEREWQALGGVAAGVGLMQRSDQQFHWDNDGYATFDDFLAALSSRKRKAIRKEREAALSSGLVVKRLQGAEITEARWDAFYAFYMDTGSRKYGRPYLNRKFFSLLGERMGAACLLVVAEREGQPVAGALNLIGGDCLYGRYWGAIEQHPFLHFELCYYQAIDVAIERKLHRVEAGAQGDHKLARGYRPVPTYSLHWIRDVGFRKAVDRYLSEERAHMAEQREMLAEYLPFRKVADETD
ncbi:MAG: N-acetyltransferase [Hyphomicrobiaceae bacterium]|nr:N-acetyltransferase [Hyphomicrobiaceae bacterium]